MDKLLYDTIVATPAVQTHVTNRVHSANSLGMSDKPTYPKFPWIGINELPSTPFQEVKETSNSTAHVYAVYVYDELGDGTRINQILEGIRTQVKTLSGTVSASGRRCIDAEWQGTSGLIPDSEYSANVKFCTIRLVANQ